MPGCCGKLPLGFHILLWHAQCERRFYCIALRRRCGRKGKWFRRQDMCFYCISFLKPLEGNICLLTPTLTHKRTIGLLCLSTLRKWILSVRIRGFPWGEVHVGDRKFGKSADAGSCRAGQGYSYSPKETFSVCTVYVFACAHMMVYACSFLRVCMNIIASHLQYSCLVSLGLKACWLQQHFNILQCGLSSQFSPLIYCCSQQLSQPICRDEISETRRMRKDFIWCQGKHHRAQNTIWISLSFPVTEAVRRLVVNVMSC